MDAPGETTGTQLNNKLRRIQMNKLVKKLKNSRGFTLLELLVVVAILAIVAGGMLVAYDGLEAKAAKGVATFDIAGVDKGIRAFKVVSGAFPDKLDGLLTNNAAGAGTGDNPAMTAGGWYAGLHPSLQGADNDLATADGKLSFIPLTAPMVTALNNAGVTKLRMIDSTLTNAVGTIPNRDFDNPPRGKGIETILAAGTVVPIVETRNFGNADIAGGSNRLKDITGLDPDTAHLIVALGVGNNSTIVSDDIGANAANFSEAPFYADVKRNQYGRYLALFHLGSDGADALSVVGDSAGELFTTAKFVGVIDAKGDWYDEEYAEFTGQKT